MKKLSFMLLLLFPTWINAQTDSSQTKFVVPDDSTAIGNPDGILVSKEIGEAGGTIMSDDGRVTLVFPVGALTKATIITVQPVDNLAQNGAGKAYRFEPSGIQFKKPVEIRFRYNDEETEICPPDLMGLAIQDNKGHWTFTDYDDWDSAANTLTGTIEHFSIASIINKVQLVPKNQECQYGGNITLGLTVVKSKKSQYVLNRNDITSVDWYVNNELQGSEKYGYVIQKNKDEPLGNKFFLADYSAPSDHFTPNKPVKIRADIFLSYTRKINGRREVRKNLKKSCNGLIYLYDAYQITVSKRWHQILATLPCGYVLTDTSSFIFESHYIPSKKNTRILEVKNHPVRLVSPINDCGQCKLTPMEIEKWDGMINVDEPIQESLFQPEDGYWHIRLDFKTRQLLVCKMGWTCSLDTKIIKLSRTEPYSEYGRSIPGIFSFEDSGKEQTLTTDDEAKVVVKPVRGKK